MAVMATSIARASACPPSVSSVRMLVEVRSGYACAPAAEAWPRPISIEGAALAARLAFRVGVVCAVIHGEWHRRLQSTAGDGACDVPVACTCACALVLQYRRPWRAAMHGRRHRAARLGERTSMGETTGPVGVAVWRRSICGAMAHKQTSELPKALNFMAGTAPASALAPAHRPLWGHYPRFPISKLN